MEIIHIKELSSKARFISAKIALPAINKLFVQKENTDRYTLKKENTSGIK
jgi:hypothetical protein